MRVAIAVLIIQAWMGNLEAAEPLALWVESLPVPPSSQPLVNVQVRNLLSAPYQGTVSLKAPEGWRIAPAVREVALEPGEVRRVAFNVEKGLSVEANRYPVEVSATGAGATVRRKQEVFCATAPYYKPTIDGDVADWTDAVPVTFTTDGKKTVIRTFWNRQKFCILVAVEEAALTGYQAPLTDNEDQQPFDGVQIAITPQDATTDRGPDDPAERFEFLLAAAGGEGPGKCFRLAQPTTRLAEAGGNVLGPMTYDKAEIFVRRKDGVTYYECSLPFAPMRDRIRPSEGREFFFSVLVHDPDGTCLRDLGAAAGLAPELPSAVAWSPWPGASWGPQPPLDNKIPWGLCASKY